MITYGVINQEAAELSVLLNNGEIEIPSVMNCLRPGVIIFAWLIICPYIAFHLLTDARLGDVVSAVGISGFLGVILLFAITNGRSLYLAIPRRFRERSLVLGFFKRKVQSYARVYAVLIALAALSG